MEKAIVYKEWLKIRNYFMLGMLLLFLFTAYSLMNLYRVIDFKGAAHIWEVMLQKDAIFINIIRFIPLMVGIGVAVAQFIPEMLQKRLKLTLHLPYPYEKMILRMVGFGFALLFAGFFLDLIFLQIFLSRILAPELSLHILMTAVVWFMGGLAAYLLTAWICLEPVWKRKIMDAVISLGVLRIFYLSETPEAYNSFIWILAVGIGILRLMPLLAAARFKQGCQD